MEQITQQPLPIKTKIAVWWMILFGGVLGIIGLLLFLAYAIGSLKCWGGIDPLCTFSYLGTFLFISYFVPALLIIKRKGWTWKIAVAIPLIMISMYLIFILWENQFDIFNGKYFIGSISILLIILLLFCFPLILLILDRKKFFEIAE